MVEDWFGDGRSKIASENTPNNIILMLCVMEDERLFFQFKLIENVEFILNSFQGLHKYQQCF